VLGASLGTNIVLATRSRLNREEAGRLVAELRIKTAGLDQQVRYLSGGNQQKAVLAKWLYAGATVFLLDEPTRGIDVRSKTEIYELVRAVAERGGAVLVASSEADELLRLADRIVVMHRGRIAGELDREGATEERILQLATGGAA
jgi:ABC-type sugar transport system ATPase subunit